MRFHNNELIIDGVIMKIDGIDLKEYEILCELIYLGYVVKHGNTKQKNINPIVNKAVDTFFNLNQDYKSSLLDKDNSLNQYLPNFKMESQLEKYIEKILEI